MNYVIYLFLNKLTHTVAFNKCLVRDWVGVPTILTAFIPWIFQSLQTHTTKEWQVKLGHTTSFHIPSYS
jgi:hypothetical protein